MTREQIINEYQTWMFNLISECPWTDALRYTKLLNVLDTIPFTYSIPMDSNRYYDGIDLRYRFIHDYGYDYAMGEYYLDVDDCSVMEMMVALALRCEENIMADPEYGDRTSLWFWSMIRNLGLDGMTNNRFDLGKVNDILNTFLNRKYKPNGEGGLFKLCNPPSDLRNIEIWYQLCWYLKEIN